MKTEEQSEIKTVRTFGKILKDGTVLELVAPAPGVQPQLLWWKSQKSGVVSKFDDGDKVYVPQELHPSYLRALLFPREDSRLWHGPRSVRRAGHLFQNYLIPEAQRTTFWVTTTWLSALFSSPIMLWVSGAEMARAMTLFWLLHAVCRRALIVTGLTPARLQSLPMDLCPTLLLNQHAMPAGLRSLLRDATFNGVVIPCNGGTVLRAACPKAIFVGSKTSAVPRGDENIHVKLPPAGGEGPSPDERDLTKIAEYFQPRLLQFRLDTMHKVRETRFAVTGPEFWTRELSDMLGLRLPVDPNLAGRAVMLLGGQQEAASKSCTVESAILEVLWAQVHQPYSGTTENAPTEIQVKNLTDLVKGQLRRCGEILQYDAEEIGAKLRNLGFDRKRRSAGKFVVFDQETRRRIHELARTFKIGTPVPRCPDCPQPPVASE